MASANWPTPFFWAENMSYLSYRNPCYRACLTTKKSPVSMLSNVSLPILKGLIFDCALIDK